jgi:eukaryotic-like serine/threonine-protein kinase
VDQTFPIPFGRYNLLELIGQGGMAEIYKAKASGLEGFEKLVVIKKILPSYANNEAFIQMLIQEAKLASGLQHGNVVQIYDLGAVDDQYYIAMEYVLGSDLLRLLARCTKEKARVPFDIAAHVVAEVAKGLEYAHNARSIEGDPLNIIHRDISPSNVLLSFQGEVKVTDFGVARAGLFRDHKTRTGVLKGKIGYMSPEQVVGRPFDHRADIFSLGILLYESITLKRLFLGRTDLETLMNIRDCRIEPKLQKHAYIPDPIQTILRRALTIDPDERYSNAGAMYADLAHYLREMSSPVDQRLMGRFVRAVFGEAEVPLPVKPGHVTEHTDLAKSLSVEETPPPRMKVHVEPSLLRAPSEPILEPPDAISQAIPVQLHSAVRPASQAPDTQTDKQAPKPEQPQKPSRQAKTADPPKPAPPQPNREPEQQPEPDPPRRKPFVASSVVSVSGGEALDIEEPLSSEQARRVAEQQSRARQSAAELVEHLTVQELRVATYRLRRSSGQIFGPVPYSNLVQLIARGAVSPAELISIDHRDWVPVNVVPALRELFNTRNVGIKARPPVLDGPISLLALPYALFQIAGKRLSGVLDAERGRDRKELYFRSGRCLLIESNIKTELFGAFLVNHREITEEQMTKALSQLHDKGGRLGDVLISEKWVQPARLANLLEEHQRDRFRTLLAWDSGGYSFHEGDDFELDALSAPLHTAQLTTDGLRDLLDTRFLLKVFADFNIAPIRRNKRPNVLLEDLGLTPIEFRAANFLLNDKHLQNAMKHITDTGAERIDALRTAYILLQAGLLEFPVRSPLAGRTRR